MRIWTVALLLALTGCRPSVQDLRAQFVKEKDKLAARELALLEFDRFKVDLAGQERIQKGDVERAEKASSQPEPGNNEQKRDENRKYIQTQEEELAVAGRLVKETRAKLVAEVDEQRQRVAEAETRMRQAER